MNCVIIMIMLLLAGIIIFCMYRKKNTLPVVDDSDKPLMVHEYIMEKPEILPKAGLVVFDIDATLSDLPLGELDKILKYCIEKNYDVAIATASMRTPGHLCDEFGNPNSEACPWMTSYFASILINQNFNNFNSLIYTTGVKNLQLPPLTRNSKMYGWRKGLQIEMQFNNGNYDKDAQCFLFDDQPIVLAAAKEKLGLINTQLVDNRPGSGFQLMADRLKSLF